jgi:TRAP-type transport system small permease protein
VRAYALLLQAFAYIAAVLVGAMALAVTLDVVGRNLGWSNTGWVVELTEYSLPVATLLVAPYLLYRNEHVRLDVVLVLLPKRISLFLERSADVLGMMICAIFVWYGAKLIMDSARLGSMVVKTLAIPEWWQYALVPVSFTLLAIEFARRLRA